MKANRKLIAAIFFLVATTTVSAQLGIGLKSGLLLGKQKYYFDKEEVIKTENVVGYEAGVLGQIAFKNRIELQLEVGYIEKGGEIPDNQTIKEKEVEAGIYINYSVPIKSFSIYGSLGGFFGYGLDAKIDKWGMTREIEFGNDGVNREDIGFVAGLGVRCKFNFGSMFLESRYRESLNYFEDVELEDFRLSIRNLGTSVSFGYIYRFNKKE